MQKCPWLCLSSLVTTNAKKKTLMTKMISMGNAKNDLMVITGTGPNLETGLLATSVVTSQLSLIIAHTRRLKIEMLY